MIKTYISEKLDRKCSEILNTYCALVSERKLHTTDA